MYDRHGSKRARPGTSREMGFTLIELLVVMSIIGIIIAFILTAAMGGVRRAEERATQSLISKLETGITDRIEALLLARQNPTLGHVAMATITNSGGAYPSAQRAQVIANIDYFKAELPDVFYIAQSGDPNYSANYPINFAGAGFGGTGSDSYYALPYDVTANTIAVRLVNNLPLTGFYGASVTARAALTKNIPGVGPRAFDGVDNDGNGLIDEASTNEGWTTTALTNLLNTHKHKTARAEVLYAILVEGQGPLGSVFDRDDFTDREVQDTDGDGLPEFVDAWGEPLQFYRWPLFFHDDLQRGYVPPDPVSGLPYGPYTTVFEPREQNPLDPNQTLMAFRWWLSANTGPVSAPGSAPYGGGVYAFQTLFHSLVEPNGSSSGATKAPYFWDRSGNARRAFYSKFLIVSSGLDRELGIARLDTFGITPSTSASTFLPYLMRESEARQTDLNADTIYFLPTTPNWVNATTGNTLFQAGVDDISNHNIQAPGGVVD